MSPHSRTPVGTLQKEGLSQIASRGPFLTSVSLLNLQGSVGLGGSQGRIKWNCRSFANKQFPTISNFAPTAKAQLLPLPFLPRKDL